MDQALNNATEATTMEVWGGVECTRNRVHSLWFDQTTRTGHFDRLDDLDRIAGLGLKTLRYPVLWEHAVQTSDGIYDWSWADERLLRLRELGVNPIAGLVHHGSGPPETNLLCDSFASGLAKYAGAVAARFPWLDSYTPVNEPLTTARFSGLYGHWYPHCRDDFSFARALLNQCRAVILSMKAIREIRSDARLVQTEDLGTTYSTSELQYQADFDNSRRWLTFDLLCGLVDKHHPLGGYLLSTGISEYELAWFQENSCPPDIIGINHYVTSDRYLDHRLELYSSQTHGRNSRQPYADLESVRAPDHDTYQLGELLTQVWNRYRRSVAVTEAHLACGREDQIRWLSEVWNEAMAARQAGADVRAVTAWALFGSFDWDSLVTQDRGHYEPGAFDIRGPTPRKTAVADFVKSLSEGQPSDLPYLKQPGWWRRPERVLNSRSTCDRSWHGAPILITGGTGTLARAFDRICQQRALPCRLLTRAQIDITNQDALARILEEIQPWGIINAAGYVRVDDAEDDEEQCFRDNVQGPMVLATVCADRKLPLATFSSDLVFDGQQRRPYREEDKVNPLNVYGRTKAEAERKILAIDANALVIRTSAFFGPWDSYNYVTRTLQELRQGRPIFAENAVISPTYIPDLVHSTLDLMIDRASGLWHLTNDGEVSWAQMAEEVAHRAGLGEVLAALLAECGPVNRAIRPEYSALSNGRGLQLRHWQEALDCYFRELKISA